MKDSPFIYGTTVSSKSFTNRKSESQKLFDNLTQGINTTIISPRRWGKSSLVEKVINDIKKNKPTNKTVLIDLFASSTEQEFLEIFAREVIKASSSKWQDWLSAGKNFFKQLIPKLSVGVNPDTDFSLSFDWGEVTKYKDEILNLPELIGEKQNQNFIICLDEFQNLANFPEYTNLEKIMRSIWQRQKHVTYCLFGSKRHMMADIFTNSSKPFYKFGDIILLPKIKTESWVVFIENGFKNTGKKISKNNAMTIVNLMKNHSWYVQQLSHYIWQLTEDTATKQEIESALLELINANMPLYQKEVESLSITQLNLLKAITNGEQKLTSNSVMQKYNLGTPRNVIKNKTTLLNNDLIHETEIKYEFLDPAFELWFQKQYYQRDYLKNIFAD